MKHILEKQENLTVKQDEIVKLHIEDSKVKGAYTKNGAYFETKAIVLTTGTYLKGRIIIGEVSYSGGPNGLFAANELSDNMQSFGIKIKRFKTGTPARINKRSVDFSKMMLDETETSLNGINESIKRIKELSLQAANGTTIPSDRMNICAEIRQLKDHIISVLNGTYSGRNIF
jgi:tRNA uridine 5-carboxymethylaminomethyl modification enzyme